MTHAATDICPSDYGISTQYYNSQYYRLFYEGNVSIEVHYKRAAYIDNSYITLSARKANAGEAYFEYWLSHKIRKVTFDISYYSYSDVLSHNDSTAVFWALKYSQNGNYFYWESVVDLINENISSNPSNPTRLVFSFLDEEIYGFNFSTTAPATGNYDSGRICIQNITIVHSTSSHNQF